MSKPFYVEPRVNSDLLWLAVDLDNTIAAPVWPEPGIGEPMGANILKIHRAVAEGWKIIIHTSRTWADYEMIEHYLRVHGIPFHRIVCGKVLAAAYIDDRNIDVSAASWIPERLSNGVGSAEAPRPPSVTGPSTAAWLRSPTWEVGGANHESS